VELVEISTRGDVATREPIGSLGGVGLFTKEIQQALLDERVDLAVHSLKDLPTEGVAGLCLAAVPRRASPRDVLVSRDALPLAALPQRASVGTGSLRRRAQLWHARRDLRLVDVRGNVDTRLAKLAAGQFDALVLAEAGLARLGFESRITQVLEPEVMLPAVGQGALAIEARAADRATREIVAVLDAPSARQAVTAERSLLAALAGGCLAPIGALAQLEADGRLRLRAVVLSPDGRRRLAAEDAAAADEAEALGRGVAERLLAAGAAELVALARQGER
jgi:hydroxymethylbilane synthase